MLNRGRHPRTGIEPFRESRNQSVDDFVKKMQAAKKEAEAALHRAADDMARYYDLHREEVPAYKPGDMVWLDGKDLKIDRPSTKLADKHYGPFKVTKVVSPSAYQLELPPSMKIHPVFNTVKLRPYQEDTVPGREPPPRPPPLIEGDEPEWEVEYIKDSLGIRISAQMGRIPSGRKHMT